MGVEPWVKPLAAGVVGRVLWAVLPLLRRFLPLTPLLNLLLLPTLSREEGRQTWVVLEDHQLQERAL